MTREYRQTVDLDVGGYQPPEKPSYEKLFEQLAAVDKKYSKKYSEPVLDMPESLNQVPLTYQAPTRDELTKQAQDSIMANYLKNLEKIQTNDASTKGSINEKIMTAEQKLDKALADIAAKFEQDAESTQQKAVTKGIARGTIFDNMINSRKSDMENSKAQSQTAADNTISILSEQLRQLGESTKSAIENLDATRDAEVQVALTKLLADVEKQQTAVAKYNNELEEAEQKYQVSRQTALEKARQAEVDRQMKILNLQSQIGADGITHQVASEKVGLIKDFMETMTKSQAIEFLNEPEVINQLGGYLNYMKAFVETLKD